MVLVWRPQLDRVRHAPARRAAAAGRRRLLCCANPWLIIGRPFLQRSELQSTHGTLCSPLWSRFLSQYEALGRPFFVRKPGDLVSLSFGVSSSGTGVPFHVHGPAFSETLYGRKRWLLYSPSSKPTFDPDESTLRWVSRESAPLDCTVAAGEAIYIPDAWWHATLNADETVFISTFVNWAAPDSAAGELRR